MLVKIIEHG